MKSRSLSSNASIFDRPHRFDTSQPSPSHNSPALNQTSIRSFFVKTTNIRKRPLSAISTTTSTTLKSTQSSISSQPRSDDISSTSFPSGSPPNIHPTIQSNTSLPVVTVPKPSQRPQQQLYIDLGQRNFAATQICPICGMLVVHGVPRDIQEHEKFCHNYQHGVVWSLAKKGRPNQLPRVCYEWTLQNKKATATCSTPTTYTKPQHGPSSTKRPNARILEIRPNHHGTYSTKLKLIRRIVDQELGFEPRTTVSGKTTNHDEPTTYLCVVDQRVVGLVVVEEITTAYRILDSPSTPTPKSEESKQLHFGLTRSNQASKAVLGIYQIWVHEKHRRRGIASTLVDVARKHMCFGYSAVPIEQIAFSSPTESGLAFAKLYHQRHESHNDVLVYDCT